MRSRSNICAAALLAQSPARTARSCGGPRSHAAIGFTCRHRL
jgi:hypothetical protein